MRRGLGFHARRSPGVFNPASLFLGGTVQGAWYDPSDPTTLFSDRAGTTPCGTPGGGSVVPVGLMLDKRVPVATQGYYSGVFNGSGALANVGTVSSFNFMHNTTAKFTIECWVLLTSIGTQQVIVDTNGGTTSNVGIYFLITATGALQLAVTNGGGVSPSIVLGTSSSTLSTGQWAHVVVTYDQSLASANAAFYINGVAAGTANKTANTPSSGNANYALRVAMLNPSGLALTGNISNLRITNTVVYTGAFTPPTSPLTAISGTQLLTCQSSTFVDNSTNAYAITVVTGASVGATNPFGNHAIAANDTTARPELRARVNLLERSEEFDNAYWTKGNTTVTANAAVAPDGTTTADLIYPSVTGTFRSVYRAFSSANSISVSAKASGKTWISIVSTDGLNAAAWFDLANGVIGTVAAGHTAAISSQGSGWYRCTVTANSGTFPYAQFNIVDANGSNTGTANGTDGVLLWGADGRPTNIGTTIPAYQRISDANTYDAVGFPRYLAFNGTSSAMSTPGNVNLSGTDKVTVFAGVRKLGTSPGVIIETMPAYNQAGGMGIFANTVASNDYGAALQNGYITGTAYTPPITNVVTASFDIAAATLATEITMRVNGATPTTATSGSASTGNFGNLPYSIGVRNLTTVFFNGNIYSLIVVGSAVSAGQISATEQWVAQRTGIVI